MTHLNNILEDEPPLDNPETMKIAFDSIKVSLIKSVEREQSYQDQQNRQDYTSSAK